MAGTHLGCVPPSATQGVAVTAILLDRRWHRESAEALLRHGGRLEPVDLDIHQPLIDTAADLVLDGIPGIGGAGALRSPAAELAARAGASAAVVVAVDLPKWC